MQISTLIPEFTVPLKHTDNFYVDLCIMHALYVLKITQSLQKPKTD